MEAFISARLFLMNEAICSLVTDPEIRLPYAMELSPMLNLVLALLPSTTIHIRNRRDILLLIVKDAL